MDNVRKLSEIKPPRPLLRRRLLGEEWPVGDVTFKLRALPAAMDALISTDTMAGSRPGENLLLTVRLGVVGILGLCDEDGLAVQPKFEKIEIAGHYFEVLSWETLSGLTDGEGGGSRLLLGQLAQRIMDLTRAGVEERQAQDFTPPASAASDAEEAGDAAASDER